ncbi:hypothetical protein [Bordetella sp. LUAb4]|uniref:hypothetical protein n=1 Tax=Bordetella sp. LUAb4 TaxID=2843195 RepID=UPI001E28E76E|nr:hypothetical protein [Bordetella sp. LUAb4]
MTNEIAYHPSPLFAPDCTGAAADGMAAQGVAQFSAHANPLAAAEGLRSQQRRRSVSLEEPKRSVQFRRQVVRGMRNIMLLLKDLASGKSPTDAWNSQLANRFDWEAKQYLQDFLFAMQNPSAPRATSIDANRARVDNAESEDSHSDSEDSQSTSTDSQPDIPSEWMTLPKPSSLSSLCPLSENSREHFFRQAGKLCEQSFTPHLKSLPFEQLQKIREGFAELRANDRFVFWPSESLNEADAYLLVKVEKMVKKEIDCREKEICASKGRGILLDLYGVLSVGAQGPAAGGATAGCLPHMARLDLQLSPINRLARLDLQLSPIKRLTRLLEKFEGRRTVDDVVVPHARTWNGTQVLTFMNHIKSAAQALALHGSDADETFKWGCDEILDVMRRQCAERPAEIFIANCATHGVDDEFWQPFHDTLNTMDKKQAYAFAAQLNPRLLQVLDSFKKKLGVGSEHIVSAIAAGRAKREGEIGAFIDAKRTALEHAVETGKTWEVANALTNLSRTMYEFQDCYMDLWDMRVPEAVENGLRASLSTADMMMRTSGGVITEEAEAGFRSFLARLSATNIDKLRVAVEALSPYGLDFMRQAVADEVVRRQQPAGAPPTYEQSIIPHLDKPALRSEPPYRYTV